MKWSGVFGGRNALTSMGAGRAKSPARDEPAKRFTGLTGARCPGKATAGGMQRGRAAGPLAKSVLYYNTHLANITNGSVIARLNRRSGDRCMIWVEHI